MGKVLAGTAMISVSLALGAIAGAMLVGRGLVGGTVFSPAQASTPVVQCDSECRVGAEGAGVHGTGVVMDADDGDGVGIWYLTRISAYLGVCENTGKRDAMRKLASKRLNRLMLLGPRETSTEDSHVRFASFRTSLVSTQTGYETGIADGVRPFLKDDPARREGLCRMVNKAADDELFGKAPD